MKLLTLISALAISEVNGVKVAQQKYKGPTVPERFSEIENLSKSNNSIIFARDDCEECLEAKGLL